MPYSLIASILVIAVVLRFVARSSASGTAKVLLALTLSATVMMQLLTPWFVAALAIQGIIGVGVVLYSTAKG